MPNKDEVPNTDEVPNKSELSVFCFNRFAQQRRCMTKQAKYEFSTDYE